MPTPFPSEPRLDAIPPGCGLRILRLTAVISVALQLGACGNVDRIVVSSSIPDDYRLRHPVVLTDAPSTLDVFMVGASGKLDPRQLGEIRAYAAAYRSAGEGPITVLLPSGSGRDASAQATLSAIRRALVSAGVRGSLNVGSYPVLDASLASPLHVSYKRLEARPVTRCGEWPADLVSGSSLKGWENRPYYNLGCSYQQNLAQQIDDPRDLVRARAEEPADVQMRTRAITNIRQGIDPATAWNIHNTAISSVGAQ